MRLLNTKTLELKSFVSRQVPDYAILSHRWGPEEVTLKDITNHSISDLESPARNLAGFSKVEGTCKLAADDGYDWVWIDSCCIDKESSADIDKSINSMWTYYTKSNICYVYMADVPDYESGWGVGFRNSEWFARGWTLQELIAPVYVEFYAADWSPIGTKLERHNEIAEITTISTDLLAQKDSVDSYTAAERFSWAAHRQVTHEEDEAYSLLGLFQIQMPMLYGEGQARAFARLQEAIYLATCDDSIFLFRYGPEVDNQPLLADSSTRFCQKARCKSCQRKSGSIECFPSQVSYINFIPSNFWPLQPHEQIITTVTPFRNEASVPLWVLDYADVSSKLIYFGGSKKRSWVSHVAILNHTKQDHGDGAFCLLLYRPLHSDAPSFHRLPFFPAFLPDIREFSSKLQKQKILITGPVPSPKCQNVDTIFSVSGDLYQARAWSAKNVSNQAVLQAQGSSDNNELKNAEFKVQTGHKNSKGHAEVSCQIAHTQNQNLDDSLQILVQLENVIDICKWSIKKISEVNFGKQLKSRTLFIPKAPSDRCTIHLSDRRQLYVGIRHSAAPSNSLPRDADMELIRKQRYQIFVRSVEKERKRSISEIS